MIPAVKYKVSTSNSGVSPRQSQERHWKPYGNSPNRACLYIASLLFAAQFYEMPGHRHRINRVINVQVNTLFTETFPTMVNLELPNFHKWSRLIVARDSCEKSIGARGSKSKRSCERKSENQQGGGES